jgi:hypothetical protein
MAITAMASGVSEKLTMVNKKHLKTGHQDHGANAYSNA